MAFDYINAQNTAERLIKNFGSTATVSRVSKSYDPVSGETVTDSVITDPANVVTIPASTSIAASFENKLIEDYKKGKIRFFYVAAKGLTFDPQAGDLFFYENTVWEIAGTTPTNPAGTPVYYTLGVAQSNLGALPVVPDTPILFVLDPVEGPTFYDGMGFCNAAGAPVDGHTLPESDPAFTLPAPPTVGVWVWDEARLIPVFADGVGWVNGLGAPVDGHTLPASDPSYLPPALPTFEQYSFDELELIPIWFGSVQWVNALDAKAVE